MADQGFDALENILQEIDSIDEQDDEGNARGIHHVLAHWEVLVYELCIDFALRVLFYILFCPPKVVWED